MAYTFVERKKLEIASKALLEAFKEVNRNNSGTQLNPWDARFYAQLKLFALRMSGSL